MQLAGGLAGGRGGPRLHFEDCCAAHSAECLHPKTPPQALDYFDNTWCLTEVLFSALQGARGRVVPLNGSCAVPVF